MFKVGDIVKIKLFDGKLSEDSFEVIEIDESSSNIYKIEGLNSNLTSFVYKKYIEYDKKYYRKEKLNKILECLK